MARVVMQAVVSVDGYIAYPDDTVGPNAAKLEA
jgi:hypothetical protein